jgi:hypothetical protein
LSEEQLLRRSSNESRHFIRAVADLLTFSAPDQTRKRRATGHDPGKSNLFSGLSPRDGASDKGRTYKKCTSGYKADSANGLSGSLGLGGTDNGRSGSAM